MQSPLAESRYMNAYIHVQVHGYNVNESTDFDHFTVCKNGWWEGLGMKLLRIHMYTSPVFKNYSNTAQIFVSEEA